MGNSDESMSNGRYLHRETLAETGHSSVVLAWDTQLHRPVVLKRYRFTPQSARRVRRLLDLRPHPNLAVVRDDFADGDAHVLVMDWVFGRRLSELPRPQQRRWLPDVQAALDYLHSLDPPFAHGDVKAENIIITDGPDRRAVLVDVAIGVGDQPTIRADRDAAAGLGSQHAARVRTHLRLATVAIALTLLTPGFADKDIARPESTRSPRTTAAAVAAVAPTSTTQAGFETEPLSTGALDAAPLAPSTRAAVGPAAAASRIAVYRHGVKAGSGEYPAWADVYHVDDTGRPRFQNKTYGLSPIWTLIAPLGGDWLLFYSAIDGSVGTAPFEPDGHMGFGDYRPRPGVGFTHMAGDGNDVVLLYRSNTGETATIVCDHGNDCVAHSAANVAKGYDQLLALSPKQFLFYDADTGRASIARVNADWTVVSLHRLTLPPGIALLTRTGSGLLAGVEANGEGVVLSLRGEQTQTLGTFSLGGSGFDAGVGFDRGFVAYRRLGLSGRIVRIDDDGTIRSTAPWSLPLSPIVVAIEPSRSVERSE